MSHVENTEQQEDAGVVMQLQIRTDLERVHELLQVIFGSDSEAYEAFMQSFEDDYDNDVVRLIAICDEAMVICSDPQSPYYQFALRKRLMQFAGQIAGTKDSGLRMRHLNTCAEYIRSRVMNKSHANELVSMIYLRIVTNRDNPVQVVTSVINQLPKGPQSELFEIKKRYLGFGSSHVLENEPS